MATSINVADLFATLGVRPDRGSWSRATKLIEGMRSAVGRLAKRAAIATAGIGVGAIALGDSYTQLENRIRQVSSSNAELNELMDRTRAIANATRSDWKSTGEAFVRLKNATKDMGLSTDRTLKLIETLNMALQSSGASSSEAAAGTLQLMQGLASGALQGDEFRSIAEQLPDLMDLFAKQLHVSRGELKKLGAEGKITSKVVVAALENASDSIRTKFAASTATAGQRWVQLKNSLMLAGAEFIRATGLGEALGRAVARISTWIEGHRAEIREFGASVGAAFGVAYDAVAAVVNFMIDHSEIVTSAILAIGAVLAGFAVAAALSWAVAFAPLIAIVAGLSLVILAIRKAARRWDDIKRAVKNALGAAWSAIKGFATGIAAPFIAAGAAIRGALVAVFEWIEGKVKFVMDKLGEVKDFAERINPFGEHTVSPEQLQRIRERFGIGDRTPAPVVPAVRVAAPAGGGQTTTNSVAITVNAKTNATAQDIAGAIDDRMRAHFGGAAAARGGGS